MLTESERHMYGRGRYGEVANLVDICMAVSSRPCAGGSCSEDHACPRHFRAPEVADRLARMRARRRERFSEKK